MNDMKPILFNTDMVRAIQAGRKTVTRRVVKPQPIWDGVMWRVGDLTCGWGKNVKQIRFDRKHTMRGFTPHYRPGDILYVRETWTHTCIHCKHYPGMLFCPPDCGTCPEFVYKADGVSLDGWTDKRWRPSIHMPREAARIFLRVTDVRVERLQDMPDRDIARDFDLNFDVLKLLNKPQKNVACMALWNSTIKKAYRALYGWEANPWVWVIEFERISRGEAVNHAV